MRLRIATWLTAGTGLVVAILWVAVLLPLQLRLGPSGRADEVTDQLRGVVSGVRDVPSPSPTPSPSPEAQYYNGTRPSLQNNTNPSSSP